VKKTRALVRLAHSGLDSATYRAELDAPRDAGRLLSRARNADVMLATVDALAARYVGHLPATTFSELRDSLAARARERDSEDAVPQAVAALRGDRRARPRVAAGPL